MSDFNCPDCPLDAEQHAELGEALRAEELDVFARADLAADAIDLAEAEALVRRPRVRLVRPALAAAAVVLAAVGLWLLTDTEAEAPTVEPDPVQTPAGDVTKERRANEAFLERPEIAARLASVAEGHWVGIAGGDTFLVAKELGALDQALVKARPHATHRFTFQRKTAGDRAYDTFFGRPPFVGVRFMANFEISIGSLAGQSLRYSRIDPKRGKLTLDVPRRAGRAAELSLHVGEPAAMASIPLLVGYSTGSAAPLVLPAGMGFPRFEIPGTATLKGGSDHPGTFRRYMSSISIPELGLREVFVEAIGNHATLEQADGSLRLGDHTWRPYTSALQAEATQAGRPVLLLERPRWLQRYPGNPFEGLSPNALRLGLAPYTLAWRELRNKEAWVGSGDEAPPVESRLSVVDTAQTNLVLRQLVVRRWTAKTRVLGLLDLGLRQYQAGTTNQAVITKNETTAIDVLWHIAYAQRGVQEAGFIDADRNGVGEYGTLWEMTGEARGRMKARLKPVRLPISFRPARGEHDLVLEGYRFRLFFPAKGGGAITAPEPDSNNVHIAMAEKRWWAYGWPEQQGKTGRRTFAVDQDNVIYGTKPWAGVYSGERLAPRFDAAFAQRGRVPGGVSPALVSSDGNRWVAVRTVERR